MELALESVLQQRTRQLDEWLNAKRSLLMSALVHLVLFSSLILIPILTHKAPEPIEFTPITIVPVQALGVEKPVAAAKRPEAAPAEPVPEPPALMETKKEPEKKPIRQETPAVQQAPATQPATAEPSSSSGRGSLGQRQGSALGSSLGTSAFGAAVGGLDNPDFVYGYYVDQMLAMIGTQWVRPALGSGVEAILHFKIERDGRVTDLRVVQSSGYNSFDLAGIRAVQTASPLPPLPTSYRRGTLGVTLIVR